MAHLKKIGSNVLKWTKIVLPFKRLRYFPPQFIVRNPVVEGVKSAFKQGCEVAILVFNINNLKELKCQLDEDYYHSFSKELKSILRKVVQQELSDDDVLVLHDHFSDGFTLFLKVDHNRSCVVEIDAALSKVTKEVEEKLKKSFPDVEPQFESGYMFIEKKNYSIQEAIYKAHQQALAMAEKRVDTEFNEMLYMIRKIVAKKDIRLLAQPIIDVESKAIRAWEMLTRGPKDTPYESPLTLFSVARQTDYLYDLEMIVLEKTFEQIHKTACKHAIFVNFTPISLGSKTFIRDLNKLLERYKNIPPSQFTIEITERDSIEGIELLLDNIKALRMMGFQIAVDDTGSGYASLNTISAIMPDIIKIDRSVIQDIDKNSVKESMLKGLLLVAKETGSLVVAEGIENAGEASVLSRNNVDLAQGYFFAKPDSLQKSLASC
ncbi:EAL domain-containing protein [Robertmurraya massiliosenegalensis]|uniref:EAL domain-containing protein n=1 Tax=Robertmurraya massiliosenegalensis TaxID=1287657 RepID=UPI0002EAE23B|nr:EAL domain-containing protein [Robertmurraya massiliosenegalensis]